MLFEDRKLKSVYDIGNKVPEDMCTLTALSYEIMRITEILYTMYKNHERIIFYYTNYQDYIMYVDCSKVSEKTWHRDASEIKEILYRNQKRNQQQFSINKALLSFRVQEPQNEDHYSQYLQLLYFFYIMNYFAFPQVNFFKKLSENKRDSHHSYDEGAKEGIYLSFMITQLLEDPEILKIFIEKCNTLSYVMEELSKKIIYYSQQDFYIPCTDMFPSIQTIERTPLEQMLCYCHQYAMKSYCLDLLTNLTKENIFAFEELSLPPFSNWKKRYISVNDIDEFLNEDEVYWFCKQKIQKIESRDRIKFMNSNAVQYLKDLISYDLQWMDLFQSDKGIIIEKHNEDNVIYALIIVIIIKTYNDLINQMKTKIYHGQKEISQPLRTALSIKKNPYDSFAPTIYIRYFLLACHSQYLNATTNHQIYYERFQKQFLLPEIHFLKIVLSCFQGESFEEWIDHMHYYLYL